MRIGIEIILDLDMPEPELAPFPVAGNDGSDKFLGLFFRVVVEVLEKWAKVTIFMMGGLGFSVENQKLEPSSLTPS